LDPCSSIANFRQEHSMACLHHKRNLVARQLKSDASLISSSSMKTQLLGNSIAEIAG
jgi:hypothetical protein